MDKPDKFSGDDNVTSTGENKFSGDDCSRIPGKNRNSDRKNAGNILKNKTRGEKAVIAILRIVAVILMAYGILVLAAVQSRHWFNFMWLAAGALLLGISFITGPLHRTPALLRWIFWVAVILCLTNFTAFEARCIKAGAAKPEGNACWVIVLGAKVNGTSPSLSFANRIDKAAGYLKENPDSRVIVTGGKGLDEGAAEADVARARLIAAGISPDRIITEDKSTSTVENLKFSRELIEAAGGSVSDSVVIVTSGFHVYRSSKLAEAAGYTNVSYMGADTLKILLPHYYTREYAANLKGCITGSFD